MNAERGIVRTQAHTIRLATPQRTEESRRVAPTPMMAPVMVWVVLMGMPAMAVPRRVAAPAVSAQNPPTGLSFVILCPIVLTIRQPPAMVPSPMAAWQIKMTQKGMLKLAKYPDL